MDDKLPQKGAWLGSRDPLLNVHVEKFCHGNGMPLPEINNAVDDGQSPLLALDANDAVH